MSTDAALLVRRVSGPALTTAELGRALGLPADPAGVTWQRTTGPDGSGFSIRLSTDPGDRLGPAVGEVSAEWPAVRPYDCYLHIAIDRTAGDDSLAALQGYGRWAEDAVHGTWPGLETSLEVEGAHGYRGVLPELTAAEVVVQLAGAEPPSGDGCSAAELAERGAPAGHPRPGFRPEPSNRHLVTAAAAGDTVTETVALRTAEAGHLTVARATGWSLPAEAVRAFVDRLLAEAAVAFDRVDVAVWVDGRLRRYEVGVRPSA
ncbi:hypothetical protein ACIRPK_16115 [Kitasatospora sp. NPDC101801]|uniref:hypothetical protein n=1 Tax=Kitasatospora sp. NPDC101801 TaxID=3364103 RepID=UPI0038030856